MTLIQTILRSAAPALVMAAMFAAAPASAGDSMNKKAVVNFHSCSKPNYPAAAIKENRTGTVTLGFLVDADGAVLDAKVNNSSGHADLDVAARDAIKLCKFEAASKDGKPVKEWMQMQYVWTLK
jgi:TonB family protein